MRDTVAAQVLPPGGAITVAMQEENNASLLSEMQEILQEQLAIRDEALHILQTKLLTVTSHAVFARMASCSHMSQVTAVANDAAAKSQSIADRVMKMIHDFETRLDTVRAEVKAVKVVLEGKTDLLDVENAVERGIVEKADASSLEEKADKVWVSQMVEALATAVKQMEEDNNAVAVRGGRECVERFSDSRSHAPSHSTRCERNWRPEQQTWRTESMWLICSGVWNSRSATSRIVRLACMPCTVRLGFVLTCCYRV